MKILNKELLESKLRKRFEDDLKANTFYYAEAYVMQANRVIARVTSDNNHVNTKPIFRLASMTKPITTVAALIQEERGKLKLEDEVSKYLPAFKDMYVGDFDENGQVIKARKADRPIRLIDVLTHTSGIISGEVGYKQDDLIPKEELINLERLVNYYGDHLLLDFSPMERTHYSGTGAFNVLARIIELTSDMKFDGFLKKNILDFLEMEDTTFDPNQGQFDRLVTMHPYDEANSKFIFGKYPVTLHLGGAGLAGTTDDYINFTNFLYNKGTYKGKRLLSEASVLRMQTPQLAEYYSGPDASEEWGLGVRVVKKDLLPKGTYGWSGAYGTHFFIDPINDIAAVYMMNSMLAGGSGALTARHFEQDIYSSFD